MNNVVKGDRVAIVATAKRLEKSIQVAIKELESWGLVVEIGLNLEKPSEYFSAEDNLRISDLQQALDDQNIKAIIFARGGYGTTKILDQLNFTKFKQSPKWLVGFSDLTSILLQLEHLELPCIHGPMAYTLGNDALSDKLLRDLIFGKKMFEIPIDNHPLSKEGNVQAKITGGNLSLIYESIGAQNEIITDNKVLFLEEVGEDFYAIDRMMNKLKRIGKLYELQGVILGNFTNVKDGSGYFNRTLDQILLSYFDHVSGPIILGYPGGHENRNLPLVFNQEAHIQFTSNQLSIEYLDDKTS